MQSRFSPLTGLLAIVGLISIAVGLSGCGGGGGGGGTTTPPAPSLTVTGTVLNSTSFEPVQGDTVDFDNNAALAATTSAVGTYSITVPLTDIAANNFVTVIDPLGDVSQAVTGSATAGAVWLTPTIYVGGPPPPPVESKKHV